MSKIVEFEESKEQLTLEQFISIGQKIADDHKDNEEEQAKAIGEYFDSVCRTER